MRPEPLPGERPRAQGAVDGPLTCPDTFCDLAYLQPTVIGWLQSGGRRQPVDALADQLLDAAEEGIGEQSQDIGSRLVVGGAWRLRAWHLYLFRCAGDSQFPDPDDPLAKMTRSPKLARKRRLGHRCAA